jgi:hypothetical protein
MPKGLAAVKCRTKSNDFGLVLAPWAVTFYCHTTSSTHHHTPCVCTSSVARRILRKHVRDMLHSTFPI